ncbi:Cysteine--tRNA ligase 1 [Pararobbsia alpina]|uniref:cysteine--tRNA ligase n=1 Tax=Pararobbsia alpina TaxID=621374 RepID=UPI0039A413C4
MALHLYDTYERTLRRFEPIDAAQVGLYCCGPTVYDHAHIGNLRSYLFEDLLRRTLEFNGHRVRHVMNITDVGHLVSDADEGEDKMEKGSRRTGQSAWDIAKRFTRAFRDDLAALQIHEPTVWCRATDHIAEQIAFVADLEAAGYTYRTDDGIYFDTSRQPDYGWLARLERSGIRAGARVELGDKRSPTDFALWKFSPRDSQRQMEWDSPWGRGFPGWHIECSAMSEKYLGAWFDIHCGGEDHIGVHHSNEIAQTQARHGTRLANFWMHGAFLQTGDAKMSKSSGEFLRLQTLVDRGFEPLAYRYLCLTAHYRSPLSFDWQALTAAQTGLERLRDAYAADDSAGDADVSGKVDVDALAAFRDALDADLNAPRALAVVWRVARSATEPGVKRATLDAFDAVLGLDIAHSARSARRAPHGARADSPPPEVLELAQQRAQARKEKRWHDADALRGEIATLGFDIEDTADGALFRRRFDKAAT